MAMRGLSDQWHAFICFTVLSQYNRWKRHCCIFIWGACVRVLMHLYVVTLRPRTIQGEKGLPLEAVMCALHTTVVHVMCSAHSFIVLHCHLLPLTSI